MFLSRVELDMRRRETVRALAKLNILHGAVEQCFEGGRERRLWRLDQFKDSCFVLILSEDRPEFSGFAKQFCGNPSNCYETKNYANFLNKKDKGEIWRFRLCANPVHSVKDGGHEKRGTLYAHATEENQKKWLIERADKNGFSLSSDNFGIILGEWAKFFKGSEKKKEVSILKVVYEGLLTVTDADLFRKSLTEGIGRAKAYGCGLLTVIRP